MKPERWQQVEKIFQSALERAPAERARLLDEACAGDASLRSEVESLLAADAQAGSFIEPSSQNALADDQAMPVIGEQIGPYRVLSLLGAGGMGKVYLAEDTRLGRRVALKLLSEGLAASEDQKRRFIQEAKSASALNHPHILTIYDIGSHEGRSFIAMEYVEGQTLRERLKKDGPLPVKLVLEAGAQIASALARAHRVGIIHRDLKPENIMLSPDGYAKILDFGLAKLMEDRRAEAGEEAETVLLSSTMPGTVVGTPRYMSPEQARGERVDNRSDIFSFGCVLYEIATGRAAFEGANLFETLNAVINNEPQPVSEINPDAPPELESIIGKCLEKDPSDRYQHADDIEVDLRRLRISIESERHRARFALAGAKRRLKILRRIPAGRPLLVLALYLIGIWLSTLVMDWVVNRYVLSPYLVDFAFVALLSLIPAVLLLAYFRAGPAQKRWKRAKIIGIPANLVAAAALLFLLFHGKDLGAATRTILVANEEGQMVERVVPKSEFRKKLAIFFFDNQSGDTSQDWLQYAIPVLLGYDLYQDLFLHMVAGYEVYDRAKKAGFASGTGLPLMLKSKIADGLHLGHFVSGSIAKQNETYLVKVSLHEAKSGKLTAENAFSGNDLFKLVDEMSVQLKRDLGIPDGHIETVKDQPVAAIFTESLSALRLCTLAMNEAFFNYNWQKAMGLLEQSVAEDPTFSFAHLQLYSLYMSSNQPAKGERAIQSMMQHIYKWPGRWEYLVKAINFDFKQDPDKQLGVVKNWVQVYPDDIEGHMILASLYQIRNERDAAIAEYQRVLELDPEQSNALKLAGRLYQTKGAYEEALKYFKRWAELFPSDAESFIALGTAYKDIGDYQQARPYFEQAVLLEPENISVLLKLAAIEFDLGNFAQALKQCQDARDTSKTPQDRMAVYKRLSSFYEALGQIAKSLENMNDMLAEGDKFWSELDKHFNRLVHLSSYIQAGKSKKAFQVMRSIEAQLAPPYDKLVPLGYLNIYLELGDEDNIKEAFEAGRRLKPGGSPLARRQPKPDDSPLARPSLPRGKPKTGGSPSWGDSSSANVGPSSRAEKISKALEGVEALINDFRIEIIRPLVFYAQGKLHEMRGEYEQAILSYTKQQEMDPTGATINTSIGQCYGKLKQFEKAEEYMQKTLKIYPFDPAAHYEIALIYSETGNREKALEHLRAAVNVWKDADPQYKPAKKAREKLAELEQAS